MSSPCVALLKVTGTTNGSEEIWTCKYKDSKYSKIFTLTGLPIGWPSIALMKGNKPNHTHDAIMIISGTTTIFDPSADIQNGHLNLNGRIPTFGKDESNQRRRRLRRAVGNRSTLAVRVIATDASTTSSEDEISDAIFGTFGDSVNVKSRYDACSFGKFRITPTSDVRTANGVYSVRINNVVTNANYDSIRDIVLDELVEEFGDLASQFDFVMICLPPGTIRWDGTSWHSFAYVNSYISVYNDVWCNYVSAQMREIGTNLGLASSGKEGSTENGDRR
mmetsp:Transcript_10183/g.15593  ORF Transcript_10183/g.15593 Transcript_10183/m.15593 type:complete len:277 (+) Transcript_10183:277-1107(+)